MTEADSNGHLTKGSTTETAILLWDFDESSGTGLVNTENTGKQRGLNWDREIIGGVTTGDGRLRLTWQTPHMPNASFAYLGKRAMLGYGAWYVVMMNDFHLQGMNQHGKLHFGFTDRPRIQSRTTVRMTLERTGNNIYLSGLAHPRLSGGTDIPKHHILSTDRRARQLTLILHVDGRNETYEVYYKLEEQRPQSIGTGFIALNGSLNFVALQMEYDSVTTDHSINIACIKIATTAPTGKK